MILSLVVNKYIGSASTTEQINVSNLVGGSYQLIITNKNFPAFFL